MAYFAFQRSFVGKKIMRVKDLQMDTTIGVTGSGYDDFYRYPASFLIPEDDPQHSKEGNSAMGQYGYMLNSRTWVYDIGLALLVFTISGDYDICEEMLKRLEQDQNYDGSWNFSYDIYIGKLCHDYIRTGTIGWLGWGICYYMLKTGDRKWLEMAKRGADYILNRQVLDTNDPRYGLLRGGFGTYDNNYGYTEVEIEWCSTEHNCSSLQYVWGIYWLTGDDKYRECASKMEYALKNTLWDAENNRFYQGVNGGKVDTAWALDCTTWAGMAALSFADFRMAEKCGDTSQNVYGTSDTIEKNPQPVHYNMSYELSTPVLGHKPYADITADYAGAPDIVWSEGTLGHAALMLKLGRTDEGYKFLDEMIKIQDVSLYGGVLYVTETWAQLPWEFHTWESVVSSAWLYILLKDPNAIWPFHTRNLTTCVGHRDSKEKESFVEVKKITKV